MPIKYPSTTQQMLVFWIAMFLLLAVSAVSLASSNRLVALSRDLEQSQRALTELNRFLSHLQDVEIGTRGYVITGNASYLAPYVLAKREMEDTIRGLRELAGEQSALQQHLPALEQLAGQRIVLADRVVYLRRKGLQPQRLLTGLDAGHAAMNRARGEFEATMAAEGAAYQENKRDVERQALWTNVALVVGVALSFAALAWLFTARSREFVRRRRAEEELQGLNAELESRVELRTSELAASRELLEAVIENMPDTVFLKDSKDEFRYVLVNGAGERLFGRQRAELVGHIDHELFPREQAALCHQEDEAVASSGEQRLIPERSLASGDETRLVESRKIPIMDTDGSQRFILGIVRDVTEQRSIENQLRQVQRMDAVGQLTGGIAHDFNNILAIILGNIDLLREQVPDGSDAAEMANEVLGAATHGADLVRRLLAFARKQHLDPTALDLNERLPAITALLRRSLGESIRVEVHSASGLWRALVDPTQVDDALVNLAINARDAMPNGGSVTIETSNVILDEDYAAHHEEVTPGEYVMLAVSDTGTGMSPEVIARAFEPFFTTKAEGMGTGLGLSQVYGWVKQSGGHIKIYSEREHGTTFKLYLPRAAAHGDVGADPSNSASEAPSGREQIFVVEDNPKVRSMVLRQLKDLGYSTIEAEDGATALKMVESGAEFDLLLTDVVMPGKMTGYDLADEVAKLRPTLRVLFTSGYTELASANSHRERNGPLLSKPYRKQDLARAVRARLDGGYLPFGARQAAEPYHH